MNYRHFLALCVPLFLSLPAAAAWPPEATAQFTQECVASAQSNHSKAQLQAYCECAADKVSGEFSEAELQEMGRQSPPDPVLQKRLIDASSSCNSKLE